MVKVSRSIIQTPKSAVGAEPPSVAEITNALNEWFGRPKLVTNTITGEKRVIYSIGDWIEFVKDVEVGLRDKVVVMEMLRGPAAEVLYNPAKPSEIKKGLKQVAEESTTSSSPKKLPSW